LETVAPFTGGRGGQEYEAGKGNIVRRGRAGKAMPTSLRAIATKARERKDLRFFNLYRLIDENFLLESWRDIRKNAAYGVDGISARQYEENLMDNIGNLVERLKRKTYRARLVRRHWIPKSKFISLPPCGALVAQVFG